MGPIDKPKGRLYTTNPAGLKYLTEEAELWQIMRAGAEIPNATIVRQLSPSKSLFSEFVTKWKDKAPETWWSQYEERFLKELDQEDSKHYLREIYRRLLLGKNVVLICFCEDHRYCHRRLVAEFFEPYGVCATELNPVKSEQLSLFN